MNPDILITGATGNVGSELVKALQAKGIVFRVGAFDVDQAQTQLSDVADIAHFDFLDPQTYATTFQGIQQMFLVRPPALSNVKRDIAPAIWAAVGAGVKHIVFLSIQGVENNKVVPHYKIEQLIKETGVGYTFLRASFFMQNLTTTHAAEIRERGEIALPVGNAKTSFIDVRDIAAVAAKVLTHPEQYDEHYTLTGSEALDYDTVASILSNVLERPIRYTRPSVWRFLRQQLAEGQKLGYALVVTALYTITRFGNANTVTDDVEAILDRKPIGFTQFAQDYRECWMSGC